MNSIKNGVVFATLLGTVISLPSHAFFNSMAKHVVSNASEKQASLNIAQQSKHALMAKLAKITFFSAEFQQTIFDESGNTLQQGAGQLSVSKPNLVNWHTVTPDESIIISDGSNLWFYDPFVEQVSVYALESAIANTPILLLTSDDPKLWQDYSVSQLDENRYLVSATNENSRVKSLELSFSRQNDDNETQELVAFNILDATGQLSVFNLTNLRRASVQQPSTSLFKFTVPEGVYIDDQR